MARTGACLGDRIVEQLSQFGARPTFQRSRCGTRELGTIERSAQAQHPDTRGQVGMSRGGLVHLALEQTAGHRSSGMALGHDGTDPHLLGPAPGGLVRRLARPVIHRQGRRVRATCAQLAWRGLSQGAMNGWALRQMVDGEVPATDAAAGSQRALEVLGPRQAPDHPLLVDRFAEPAPSRQTARRLRPLARLALMTARPPRVCMRTRKPCVRARRTLEA